MTFIDQDTGVVIEMTTSIVQKTSSSLDVGTMSSRQKTRFSSSAIITLLVDNEMQGSHQVAPRCQYAGKQLFCVV